MLTGSRAMRILLPELDNDLGSAIESILLVAGGPVSLSELGRALELPREDVRKQLEAMSHRRVGGIRLELHGNDAQLTTAPENAEFIHRFLGSSKPPALSKSLVETLSVVAYRQPVTRVEVEVARGVNSDYALRSLLARGLIDELGTRQVLGRPTEYGTTSAFLEYFGLTSIAELPPLDETAESGPTLTDIGLREEPGEYKERDSVE